jgi:hypothetical protein
MKQQVSFAKRVCAAIGACAFLAVSGCGRAGAGRPPLLPTSPAGAQIGAGSRASTPETWPESSGIAAESKSLGAVVVFASDSNGNCRPDLAQDLAVSAAGDTVSIYAKAPEALGGFYIFVRYDPSRVSPSEASDAQGLATRGCIFLAVTSVRGYVPIGLVPTRQAASPVEASATTPLVTVQFRGKSFSSAKTVSSPPEGDVNKVSPIITQTTNQQCAYIDFDEKCKGDYNNDGAVDIIDLQPVANFYLEKIDQPPDDAHKLVDGDGDPEINIVDLQPIAANYEARIQGYRVYRGQDNGGGAYTWEPTYRPNVVPAHTDESIDRTDAPPVSTRPHYRYQDDLSAVADKTKCVYEIAPFGDGAEGVMSDVAPLPPPAVDATPPTWDSTVGITGATAGDSEVTVTWGTATDLESPPVAYRVYYSLATPIDFGTAPYIEFAGVQTGIVPGLANDVVYHFAVRARDSYSPPNIDTNTNEMQATPAAFFARPPSGRSETALSMEACSMTTTPGYSAPSPNYDTDAPIIIAEDPTDHSLKFIHYNGGWKMNDVIPGLAVDFPSVAFINNKPYVAGYNPSVSGNRIVLLTGTESGAAYTQETVDNASISSATSVRIAYEPSTGTIGVVYCVDAGTGREVRFASRSIAGGSWAVSTVDADADVNSVAVGGSAAFDPQTDYPRVSYGIGTVVRDDTTHSYYVHTVLKYAAFDGNTWTTEDVNGSQEYAQDTSLYIDAAGDPTIAYLGSHDKTFPPTAITLPMFDAKVAEKSGGVWSVTTEAAGDGSLNFAGTLTFTFNGFYTSLDGNATAGLADVYARIQGTFNVVSQTGANAMDILYATSTGTVPWSPLSFDASGGRSLNLKLNAQGQKSVAFIKQTSLDYAAFFNGAPQPAGVVAFERD